MRKLGYEMDDNGKIIDWVALKAEVKMPRDKIIIFGQGVSKISGIAFLEMAAKN